MRQYFMTALIAVSPSLAASAAADGVTLHTDDREVNQFFDGGNSQQTPAVPFAAFNVPYQNSTVTPTLFSGVGSGYGESDFSFFIAESTYDITFEASVTTDIDLSGTFAANAGDFGFANVIVQLYQAVGADSQVVYADSLASDFEPVDGTFSHQGTLSPGHYRLLLDTQITPGGFDTTGDWSFTATFTNQVGPDADGDGTPDDLDNCSFVVNATQTDADGDGYGNECDADLNNDCSINAQDLGQMKAVFFSSDAIADLNVDGIVNALDLGRLKNAFFGVPGPSGVPGLCDER